MSLRDLSDLSSDALLTGVLALVRRYRPMQVLFVGGEPLIRHRELSCILPMISETGVFSLVVTSAVVPIPAEWMKIPNVSVAVSADGLPEDHDVRRKPATYERILRNIKGREVHIHWVITRPMLRRPGYLEKYLAFWSVQREVRRIWVSLYTPQVGEQSAEKLLAEDRQPLARQLAALTARYAKLVMNQGIASTLLESPKSPDKCLFAKMSANFSADLKSRVEPCVFGGRPDCSLCGCAISTGLNSIRTLKIARVLKIDHFVLGSTKVGLAMNRVRARSIALSRWGES